MGSTVSSLVEHQHMRTADRVPRTRLHPKLAPALTILPQFSRYTLVSGLALILDFAVYLLLAAGGMQVALAGALGYACGLALHYMLSVRYVFDARAAHKGQSRLFAEFAVSGLAGMAITALVIRNRRPGRSAAAASQDPGGRRELPGGLRTATRRRVCRPLTLMQRTQSHQPQAISKSC
jgi:putative flippase GtrA